MATARRLARAHEIIVSLPPRTENFAVAGPSCRGLQGCNVLGMVRHTLSHSFTHTRTACDQCGSFLNLSEGVCRSLLARTWLSQSVYLRCRRSCTLRSWIILGCLTLALVVPRRLTGRLAGIGNGLIAGVGGIFFRCGGFGWRKRAMVTGYLRDAGFGEPYFLAIKGRLRS